MTRAGGLPATASAGPQPHTRPVGVPEARPPATGPGELGHPLLPARPGRRAAGAHEPPMRHPPWALMGASLRGPGLAVLQGP